MKTSTRFLIAASFAFVGTAFALWTAWASGFEDVSAIPFGVGLGAFLALFMLALGAGFAEDRGNRHG